MRMDRVCPYARCGAFSMRAAPWLRCREKLDRPACPLEVRRLSFFYGNRNTGIWEYGNMGVWSGDVDGDGFWHLAGASTRLPVPTPIPFPLSSPLLVLPYSRTPL